MLTSLPFIAVLAASYSWAHNDYLQLLTLGIPGAILLVWMIAAVWGRARRVREELSDDPNLCLHAGYCAAVIAIALHSITDFSLHMPPNAALLSVILAVVVGMAKPAGQPKGAES